MICGLDFVRSPAALSLLALLLGVSARAFADDLSAKVPHARETVIAEGSGAFECLAGGVYLGQTAKVNGLDPKASRIEYTHQGGFAVHSSDGRFRYSLPRLSPQDLIACYEFSERNESDLVVSLDADSNLSLARPFWDTRAGLELANVDLKPWKYIRPAGFTSNKSMVMDESVAIHFDPASLSGQFHVVVKVGYARRLAAKENHTDIGWFAELFFENDVESGSFRLRRRVHGETSTSNPLPFGEGVTEKDLKKLAFELEPAAEYACWVAFFRWAKTGEILGLDEAISELRRPIRTNAHVRNWHR